MKNIQQLPCLMFLLLVLAGCEDLFETHPYDVHFNGETDINARQIPIIEEKCRDKETIRVAFISDTHGWYSDTEDMVKDINGHNDIDFVVHCGDLTDTGTAKEYKWIRKILSKIQVPYVALIGNHDFLGTGNESYQKMFGQLDFSFIAARIKFVCLNTNATEYDYLAAVPNFDFMETEMTKDSARFDRTLLVMHARPYSDQFNNNVAKAFGRYITFFPRLICCISAHDHTIQADDLYGDGTMFYGVDCAEHRNYHLFTITKEGYDYEVVHY